VGSERLGGENRWAGSPAAAMEGVKETSHLLFFTKSLSPGLHWNSWHIWKHRHDMVFRGEQPCLDGLLAACCSHALLWQYRQPHADMSVTQH
jgi:hypothetical protein